MIVRAFLFLSLLSSGVFAQTLTPVVTSWKLNLTNEIGHNGIPTNVLQVQYSSENVYVSCACIPGYDIGPWAGNPNDAANQNFTFKLTRSPQVNGGTKTATPNGHIGVWSNGVSIFNASDARSYNNKNIWFQNAFVSEGSTFDDCLGHPAPNGEYHHHVNPTCLYDDRETTRHSPIIGYAFDGFPIYGAYAYEGVDGTGGIVRMRTGYRERSMTSRRSLPDGTPLTVEQYGPDVSAQYPLGTYIQDFEFVEGLGTLDRHNGRFCVTPEYPAGTYAYFVTISEARVPEYPFTLGPTYYGILPSGNTGPQSGHNTPSEAVESYVPASAVAESSTRLLTIYPNPALDVISFGSGGRDDAWGSFRIRDVQGKPVLEGVAGGKLDVATLPAGFYTIEMETRAGASYTGKFSKR